jgi:hypothetical protein
MVTARTTDTIVARLTKRLIQSFLACKLDGGDHRPWGEFVAFVGQKYTGSSVIIASLLTSSEVTVSSAVTLFGRSPCRSRNGSQNPLGAPGLALFET